MENNLKIDVATLDAPHRKALEEVIGQQLAVNQRLIISVADIDMSPTSKAVTPQTLADWTQIYDGLSDEEIENIDQVVKTRANLTRELP